MLGQSRCRSRFRFKGTCIRFCILSQQFSFPEAVEEGSLVAQLVNNPPAMQVTWVWSLVWEDPMEKRKATRSSILAWRIPGTMEFCGGHRVGHHFHFQYLSLCWDIMAALAPWRQERVPSWNVGCLCCFEGCISLNIGPGEGLEDLVVGAGFVLKEPVSIVAGCNVHFQEQRRGVPFSPCGSPAFIVLICWGGLPDDRWL